MSPWAALNFKKGENIQGALGSPSSPENGASGPPLPPNKSRHKYIKNINGTLGWARCAHLYKDSKNQSAKRRENFSNHPGPPGFNSQSAKR